MKVMEERIREKQVQVVNLKLALNNNLSTNTVHMEFIPSSPVPRHRSGWRGEVGEMGALEGKLF